ncbi:hypothetical protein [Desulfotruncus alcoholivorax]|uniref:hypothetical protein n=1 Tax=Desulfotruncus alcoholivorax TaxID=265477 RepID=UPI000412FDCC|nr:hypothetical protein [Desulfotruncus alcoholivorax]
MNETGCRNSCFKTMTCGWTHVVTAILLLFMFFIMPGSAWAKPDDSPVQIKVELGWQGKVVPGRYAPAVVKMKNTGKRDLAGTIEAINYQVYMLPPQPGAAPGTKQLSKFFPSSAYGAMVSLPAGAEKTVTLWFPADGSGGRTDFVFKSGSKEVARVSEKSKAAVINGPMPGAVGVLGQVPAAMERVRLTMPDGVPRSPMVLELTAELFPRRGGELNAFTQILVTAEGALSLSDEQRSALAEWVKSGGQLVLSGGLEINEALSALPDQTININVQQIEPQSGWQAAAQWLNSAGSGAVAAPAAVLSGDGTPWGPKEKPLGRQYILGDGGITVLCFDPNQAPWQAGAMGNAFWQKFLTPVDQEKYYNPYGNDFKLGNLVGNTTNMPVQAFPGWRPVGLYLLAFLLLAGPGVFLVLRRMRRPEYTWVAVPVLAVLFAGAVYGYMLQSGGKVLVNVVQVLDNRDGKSPSGYTAVGYFAPTVPVFESVMKDPDRSVMVQPMGGRPLEMMSEDDDPPYSVIRGSDLRVRFSDASQWNMRAISFRDDDAAGIARGLGATVEVKGNQLVGKIKNDTGLKLDHATFFYGSDYRVVGDLQPGGEASVEMKVSAPQYNPQGNPGPGYPSSWQVFMYPGGPPPSPKPGMPPPVQNRQLTVEEQRRANLIDNWMNGIIRQGPMATGWPLTVLAWSDSPAGNPGLKGISGTPFYLTMFVLKPEIKMPAGIFNIPAGLVVPEVIDSQVRGMFGNNNLMGLDGGSISFMFSPRFGPKTSVKKITVHMDYFPVQGNAKGMGPPSPKPAAIPDGVLEIYHPGHGAWQTLSGPGTFTLTGDYALPDGEVRLRVTGGDPNKGTGFYMLTPTVAYGGDQG